MPDCLSFLRYWAIRLLQLFVSQVMTSYILKLTLSFSSSHFSKQQKFQDKNSNILRKKRALRWNKKHSSLCFKGFQLPKIVSDLRMDLKSIALPSSVSVAYVIRKFRWERSHYPFLKPPNFVIGTEKILKAKKGEFPKKL